MAKAPAGGLRLPRGRNALLLVGAAGVALVGLAVVALGGRRGGGGELGGREVAGLLVAAQESGARAAVAGFQPGAQLGAEGFRTGAALAREGLESAVFLGGRALDISARVTETLGRSEQLAVTSLQRVTEGTTRAIIEVLRRPALAPLLTPTGLGIGGTPAMATTRPSRAPSPSGEDVRLTFARQAVAVASSEGAMFGMTSPELIVRKLAQIEAERGGLPPLVLQGT